MESAFFFALGLTVFAGLSTGIGSFLGPVSKTFNPELPTLSPGSSAGLLRIVPPSRLKV